MGGSAFKATIEFRSIMPPAGLLVVENESGADLRIWRQGNSWGDAAMSFNVAADGGNTRVTKVAKDYTRNVPASISVPPGGHHGLPFDLGDGSWQPASSLSLLGQTDASLEAVYDSGDSPELHEQGVWQGELRSGFYPLH